MFSDLNVPNRLNRSIDFRAVTLGHDQQLTNYRQEWAERFERDSNHNGSCHLPLRYRYVSSAFPDIGLIFPVMVQILPACSVSSSCLCMFQILFRGLPFLIYRFVLRIFSRCSYTNYVRLVMFSFGFQKAFQRGFEPDDEVFFTRVRILLGHTVSAEINANRRFQRAWKVPRPSSRYSSILWFRPVTYVMRQTVCTPHATLFSFSMPHTFVGYFVFAAFASAFMLKVRNPPFYRHMEQASVLTFAFPAASAPRMFEVHHDGSRIRDLSSHRAPHPHI